MITNNTGLPEAIVKAVENDSYDKGRADYSATGLLRPGYMNSLYSQHGADIEEDASDRIFSLLGQLIHVLFERADINSAVVEQRLFADVNGCKISGQIDIRYPDKKLIQDYKLTTIYKLKDTSEYEKQLNIYRYLCYCNDIEVDNLQVVLIFRDWSKMKAKREFDYPQRQVAIVDIPVWTIEEAEAFIKSRIQEQINKTR